MSVYGIHCKRSTISHWCLQLIITVKCYPYSVWELSIHFTFTVAVTNWYERDIFIYDVSVSLNLLDTRIVFQSVIFPIVTYALEHNFDWEWIHIANDACVAEDTSLSIHLVSRLLVFHQCLFGTMIFSYSSIWTSVNYCFVRYQDLQILAKSYKIWHIIGILP